MSATKNIVMFATILGLVVAPGATAADFEDAGRVCISIEDENLPVAAVYVGAADTVVCIPLPDCSALAEGTLVDGPSLPQIPCFPPCDAWDIDGRDMCLYDVYDPQPLCMGDWDSEPHAHNFYNHYHFHCDSSGGGGDTDVLVLDGVF